MDLSKFWHHTKLLTAFAAYIEESHGPDVTIDEYLHYHMIDTLKKDKSQQRKKIITDAQLEDSLFMMDNAYLDAKKEWMRQGIDKKPTGRKKKTTC